MSRLTSAHYSEGELSDSPDARLARRDNDEMSVSLSEDDHHDSDATEGPDIKPPQPQQSSFSRYKSAEKRSTNESKRSRDSEMRHGSSRSRNMERREKEGRHGKGEGKDERRPSSDIDRGKTRVSSTKKEDLRERLERERRLRMRKDQEAPRETQEQDRHRSANVPRRARSSGALSKEVRSEHSKESSSHFRQHEDKGRSDKNRRQRAELYDVLSSPESEKELVSEVVQEMINHQEEDRHSTASSSKTSDEGEASSSSTSTDDEQHDEDASPDVKRRKSDKESEEESPEKNNTSMPIEESPKKEEDELPPYLPAIMGCRSVGEFQCLNKIEEGTYGVVYRAQDKRTNEIVALKRLKMEREKEGFPITSLREVSTLLKAQHENIVTVREIVVGSNMDSIYMVMDYVEHDLKSLMEVLKTRKQFFLPGEVKCLLQQLLRAVAHLHDNWILHRDLKTSNILLSHSGILKVGDFGLAREYGSPLKAYTSIVVTLWYRAPELLLGAKEYSTPIDVWSVGCIFGELLTLEAIFQGKFEADQINKIFKELGTPNDNIWPGYSELPMVKKANFANNPTSNLRKKFSSRLSELGLDLLQKFLTYDPAKRITAEDALNHTYLKEPPFPIHPSMLPTWPAKSESHGPRKAHSPKPPSGGRAFKQLGENDEGDVDSQTGFHMGGALVDRHIGAVGPGFSLKF